jgi:hypothetical protein
MNRLLIPALLLITACNSTTPHDTSAKTTAHPVTDTVERASTTTANKQEPLFDMIRSSKNAAVLINDSRWSEYESSGDPDTALVLFGYRIIEKSDTSFEEPESYIRLYQESNKVKQLMPQIFKSDTTVSRVLHQLGSLNQRFKAYAESEVAVDIKEFGQSDGPLYDFISSLKK